MAHQMTFSSVITFVTLVERSAILAVTKSALWVKMLLIFVLFSTRLFGTMYVKLNSSSAVAYIHVLLISMYYSFLIFSFLRWTEFTCLSEANSRKWKFIKAHKYLAFNVYSYFTAMWSNCGYLRSCLTSYKQTEMSDPIQTKMLETECLWDTDGCTIIEMKECLFRTYAGLFWGEL